MSGNTSNHEGKPDIGPLELATSRRQFVADHFRFWLHEKGQTPPEHLPKLADLVILTDLPKHVEADPDFRASTDQYPPIRSEIPPINLGTIVEQIRLIQAQQPES